MTAACAAGAGSSRVLTLQLSDATYNGHSLRGFSIGGNSGGWSGGSYINAGVCSSTPDAGDDPVQITWLINGAAANYDIKVTLNSGTLTSGTTGSWLNLGTSRSWQTSGTAVLGVEIGYAGASSALVSCIVTLAP